MKNIFSEKFYGIRKNNRLCSKKIEKLVSQNSDPVSVFVYKKIDSTNSFAKKLLKSGLKTPAIITADTQTQGRGRLGRSFYSPKKTGIYMSVIVFPDIQIYNAVSITTAAAVAVVRAIKHFAPLDLKIKWVNDIFLNNRKVCGILTETSSSGLDDTNGIIIGVGINLTTTSFPQDIAHSATSLNCDLIKRNQLVAQIAKELFGVCKDLSEHTYMDEYRKYSLVLGKEIEYSKDGKKTTAKAIGVEDDGGLVVEHHDKTKSVLTSGEISVSLK